MQRIKKGDKVKIIAGKYKGQEGIVITVFPKKQAAIVENINKVKVHQKKEQDKKDSGIIEKEAPLSLSKLALIDVKAKNIISKIRYGLNKEGKKVRIAKRSNNELEGGK